MRRPLSADECFTALIIALIAAVVILLLAGLEDWAIGLVLIAWFLLDI